MTTMLSAKSAADRDRFFALMMQYNTLGNQLNRLDTAEAGPVLEQMAVVKADMDLLLVVHSHNTKRAPV
jgi:hypothetical protein